MKRLGCQDPKRIVGVTSRLRSLTQSGIGQILNQRLVTTITASA